MKLHEQKSNNFFNDVKRQQHEFEVVTDKAGGGPRNLERALDARMKNKSISTLIYSGTERSLLNITDEL